MHNMFRTFVRRLGCKISLGLATVMICQSVVMKRDL
ncbi:hypothetical protein X975_12216, partial [Stegodyphus mimosarum]